MTGLDLLREQLLQFFERTAHASFGEEVTQREALVGAMVRNLPELYRLLLAPTELPEMTKSERVCRLCPVPMIVSLRDSESGKSIPLDAWRHAIYLVAPDGSGGRVSWSGCAALESPISSPVPTRPTFSRGPVKAP